jgi:nucleoid-associated protein YgaU
MVRGMFFFIGLIAVAVILAVVMLAYAFRHPGTVEAAVSEADKLGQGMKDTEDYQALMKGHDQTLSGSASQDVAPKAVAPAPAGRSTAPKDLGAAAKTTVKGGVQDKGKAVILGDLLPVIDNTPSAGNKSTTAPPAPASPAAAVANADGTYTVQSGDSLYKIAQRKLGDGNRWHVIAEANSMQEPYTLKVGMKIKLPQ